MTVDKFISEVQQYYGAQYHQGQRAYILRYLEGYASKYGDRCLDHLAGIVIKRFSSRWGVCPDIAILEEHKTEALDAARHEQLERNTQALQIEDKTEYVEFDYKAFVDKIVNSKNIN